MMSLWGLGAEQHSNWFEQLDCCETRSPEYKRTQILFEAAPANCKLLPDNFVAANTIRGEETGETAGDFPCRRGISLPVHPCHSNGGRVISGGARGDSFLIPRGTVAGATQSLPQVSGWSHAAYVDPCFLEFNEKRVAAYNSRHKSAETETSNACEWMNQSILDLVDDNAEPLEVLDIQAKAGVGEHPSVSPLRPHAEAKIKFAKWLVEKDLKMQKNRQKKVLTSLSPHLHSTQDAKASGNPTQRCTRVSVQFRASDLVAKDMSLWHGRSSDPYLVFEQNGRELGRTDTVMNNRNPIWQPVHFDFEMDVKSLVSVRCFDWDRLTRDDLIGTQDVSVQDLLTLNQCFHLHHEGKTTGVNPSRSRSLARALPLSLALALARTSALARALSRSLYLPPSRSPAVPPPLRQKRRSQSISLSLSVALSLLLSLARTHARSLARSLSVARVLSLFSVSPSLSPPPHSPERIEVLPYMHVA